MAAPQRHWGYHRLADEYAAELVRRSGVRSAELVVDIGAGTGAITRHLLAAGAHVIAVELHPHRAALLRERFGGTALRVVQCDIATWCPPRRPYHVVANPPFGMLATLLRRITAPGSRLRSADIVVPAHVAGRWARGAVPRQQRYDARTVAWLPDRAFIPPATQRTAVLRIERQWRAR